MENKPRKRGVLRSGDFGLVPWDGNGFHNMEIYLPASPPKDPALFEDWLEESLRTGLYSYGVSDSAEAVERWHRCVVRPRVQSVPMHRRLRLQGEDPVALRTFWDETVASTPNDSEAVMTAGRVLQKRWFKGARSGKRTLAEAVLDFVDNESDLRDFARSALGRTLLSNLLALTTHPRRMNVQANHLACVVVMLLHWYEVTDLEDVLVLIGEHDLSVTGAGLVRLMDLRASDPAFASTPLDLLVPLI